MTKRILSVAMSAAMLVSMAACSGNTAASSTTPAASSAVPAASSTASAASSEASAAVDTSETIKFTLYQANNTSGQLASMGEQLCFQELAKATNVEIEWQHPADGTNGAEQLNLMIASNQLPDVILWDFRQIAGGITKIIADNVAIPLNDYMDTYAPNYKAILEQYPDLGKLVPLDDGSIPGFYGLDTDTRRTTYAGMMIRQDWLEKLGLEMPTTVDEFYNVLKAFKEQDPNGNGLADEIPWSETSGQNGAYLAPMFGIYQSMYIEPTTGKIDFGPANAKYKDFLTAANKWYSEGLIDPEFVTNDGSMLTSKVVGNLVGVTRGMVGGGVGNYTAAARADNPEFSIIGMPTPKAADGVSYMNPNDHLMRLGGCTVVTSQCENIERVIYALDYAYSEKGQTLLNYGVEGVSYEVKDGKKVFMDHIMNPPEGKTVQQMAILYAQPNMGWGKVMDFEAQAQVQYQFEEQSASIENWLKSDPKMMIHPNITLNNEESSEYSAIFNEISTYVSEMTVQFILGNESLDNFDTYVQNLKNMNLDRAIEIQQAAYDRFLQR